MLFDPETNATYYTLMSQFEPSYEGQGVTEGTLFMLWFLLSVTENSMVLILICRNTILQTVPFMLIGNLALSDIVSNATMPIYGVVRITRHWIFGSVVCKISLFSDIFTFASSSLTMILISIDRFYCIKRNINWISKKRIAIALLVKWCFAFILSVPSIFARDVKSINALNETFTFCTAEMSDTYAYFGMFYFRIVNVCFTILPTLILVVMYFKISRMVRTANLRVIKSRITPSNSDKRQMRLFKMFSIIVLNYIVSRIPPICTFLFGVYFKMLPIYPIVATLTIQSAAIVNPVIYGYFNSHLRKLFVKTFCFSRMYKPSPNNTQATE